MRWLLILVVACSSKKSEPPPKPPPRPVTIDAGVVAAEPLEVHLDKRIELLSIVMRLSGAPEYKVASTKFAQLVDRELGKFANHRAVRMTAELRAKHGIAFDAPMVLAVHLDGVFALNNPDEIAQIDKRWEGVDLVAYADALRAFEADAKLHELYRAHEEVYEEAAAAVKAIGTNPAPFFDQLFGKRGDHIVVPGMLLGTNNVGVRNGNAYYQILSTPTLPILVHEMAHSYINPWFAKHQAELASAGTALYPLFEPAMRAQNYADWQTMLNEAAVRALTVLYMRQTQGDVAGAAAAMGELRAGFVWTNELVEVFRKYQRDAAPSEDALMPRVIAFFDELAKQYAGKPPRTPFLGPFDVVLRGDYVLSLPKGAVADYAKALPFFANKPIVDPAATVPPGQGIVAYGTPATNAMIAGIAVTAGWKFTPDGIELGAKKFVGPHLVLIATWFRRDDPTRGIAVYAATSEADLIGINHNVRHGSHDWLVARRTGKTFEVVETGDWPFYNGAWIPFK